MKLSKPLALFALYATICCTPKQQTNESKNVISLNQEKLQEMEKIYENAGELISEINFELIPTDKQKVDWPEGVIPWISVENPKEEINQLKNANEIVIKEKKVTLIIDYPLTNVAFIEISNPNGFTRKDLILEISKHYNQIYNEEEATAKTKTVPLDKRSGLINRNQTNGKYGIWGHDLSDLDLSTIEIHKSKEGKINLILLLES